MEFRLHPNQLMGLFVGTATDIDGTEIESIHVFELTDDERSQQYLAWVEEGNVAEEWNSDIMGGEA